MKLITIIKVKVITDLRARIITTDLAVITTISVTAEIKDNIFN